MHCSTLSMVLTSYRSSHAACASSKPNVVCRGEDKKMMIEEIEITAPVDTNEAQQWSAQLQRRVMRLLLQHDEPLFRNQFRHFFVSSSLPSIPLLRQYDRYIKLSTMS